MGFVDQNLMPGEVVHYRARLHWVIFSIPLLLGGLGLPLIGFGASNRSIVFLLWAGALLLLVAAGIAVSKFVTLKTSEFAVTNRRVLIKVGFISRHSLELLLPKVEGIGVDQSVVGRILDFGTIVVTGTGGTREAFKNIAHPLEFRKQVQTRVAA